LKTVRPILCGGALAGALDLLYAFVVFGMRGFPPPVILQSIASGLQGRAAYGNGIAATLLGLSLHFTMTITMAAAFVAVVRAWPVLNRRPLISGPVYGLVVFAVMNGVVVPLSAAWPGAFPRGWLLAGALFTHTVFVGLPIAWCARRLNQSSMA